MNERSESFVEFPRSRHRRERVWQSIVSEAQAASKAQPDMASFFHSTVLNRDSFADAICFLIPSDLANTTVSAMTIWSIFQQALSEDDSILDAMLDDLLAHYTRDAACNQTMMPLLYFKGFHALQSYRIAHWLWSKNRRQLALYLQHRIHALYDVDIHSAAKLGSGIMLDHATGLVIGETATVGDNVSILHNVTLGGSGAHGGDRHPNVGSGVLLSAGAKLLGNIRIGEGAKIGAGSVVLNDVAPHTTVVGVPAKPVGGTRPGMPSLGMDQSFD
ncbi:MAG: serine O-acetyltransferase [Cellvibrionaceae bacterium]|jgi:serine O-acetyltransferase